MARSKCQSVRRMQPMVLESIVADGSVGAILLYWKRDAAQGA